MTSAHPGASLTATPFVDKIDPFKKGSLKRKPKKSQGSSRYRSTNDVELQALPLLKGKHLTFVFIPGYRFLSPLAKYKPNVYHNFWYLFLTIAIFLRFFYLWDLCHCLTILYQT